MAYVTLADGTEIWEEETTATGSGVIDSFLRIDDTSPSTTDSSSQEEGINTDGDHAGVLDDVSNGQDPFIHMITLGDVELSEDGQFRVFHLDLNEPNSTHNDPGAPAIDLTRMQLWTAASATLTNFDPSGAGSLPTGTLIWNLDSATNGGDGTTVNLSDWNSGSGHGDYAIKIPVEFFNGLGETANIYLYAEFKNAEGGFEEFYVVNSSGNVIETPSVAIEKTGDLSEVTAAGQTIHYTIAVDNVGNMDLRDVNVADGFADAGSLQYVSGDDGDNVLETNETWVYSAQHTVTQAEMNAGGTLVNVATVTTDRTAPVSDDAVTAVVQNPSLSIDKVADRSAVDWAGQIINYIINVANTGNIDLASVELDDQFAAATLAGGDVDGDGVLDVGETWIYNAAHTVTQAEMNAGGVLTNVATVTTDRTGPKSDDATTEIIQLPSLSIDKVADRATVDWAGQVINYTINVANTGNIDLTNVVLDDQFAAATLVGGDSDGDNELDVGESWQYTASHTVTQDEMDAGGVLTNVASVDTDRTDPQSDSANTDIIQRPDFTIEKNVTSVTGGMGLIVDGAGDVINYEVLLSNTGNITLTGVSVQDPFAPNLYLAGGDSDGDGKLDVGETWRYLASHVVTAAEFNAHQTLVNVATADTDQTGPKSDDAITALQSVGGLTAGFWGQHFEAWNGVEGTNKQGLLDTANLMSSGVLTKADLLIGVDSNRDGLINGSDSKGVLLGDANVNGLADDGANLFVSLAAVQQIILSSDSANDTRQILMKQALAAQLNINNGDHQPANLIGEAVQWLQGRGPYQYGSNSTGNVDKNGDGILGSDDYSTSAKAFLVDANGSASGTALTSNLNAWQTKVDADDTSWNVQANGEGLKNALMYFNQNQLITTSEDDVAFSYDHVNVFGLQANTLDAFWHTLDAASPDIKGIGGV